MRRRLSTNPLCDYDCTGMMLAKGEHRDIQLSRRAKLRREEEKKLGWADQGSAAHKRSRCKALAHGCVTSAARVLELRLETPSFPLTTNPADDACVRIYVLDTLIALIDTDIRARSSPSDLLSRLHPLAVVPISWAIPAAIRTSRDEPASQHSVQLCDQLPVLISIRISSLLLIYPVTQSVDEPSDQHP